VNVVGANQLGEMQGNHATDRGDFPFKREPLYGGPNFAPVKFGNELATNVGKGGPGAGREVMPAGSQCLHGNPVQGAKDYAPDAPATTRGPDIHSMYGPERTIKR
jgi:hypothetical protein